jgi:hypothetical protein
MGLQVAVRAAISTRQKDGKERKNGQEKGQREA